MRQLRSTVLFTAELVLLYFLLEFIGTHWLWPELTYGAGEQGWIFFQGFILMDGILYTTLRLLEVVILDYPDGQNERLVLIGLSPI
jgi:hypothetical protein